MKRCMIIICSLLFCILSSIAYAGDNPPRLGLSLMEFDASPILLQHLKLAAGEGVMIRNVAVGGDLEAAGLSQGDILLAIDGHAMAHPQDVTSYINSLPRGTKVTLDVIQKGDHVQIYSVLDNLPDEITWKYAEPQQQNRNRGGFGAMPSTSSQFSFGPGQVGTQRMTFRSVVQTSQGAEVAVVTINGNPEDPESEVEVILDNKKYASKIGEIDALPEDARLAAQQALNHSGQFSFSFSFGGNAMFEEMLRRQQAEMDAFEQMFFRSIPVDPNSQPPAPAPKQDKPKKSAITIEPAPIKS